MNAIADNIDGLKQLSVERVWMEMGKIIPMEETYNKYLVQWIKLVYLMQLV